MKYNGDAKIIKAKVSENPDAETDLFTDEPVQTPWEKDAGKKAPDDNGVDYEPAPDTDMDFMTEEEEKEKRKGVIIGTIIGLLIAALLIGGFIYHNQSGKIKNANVPTTVTTEKESQKYGSLEPTQSTTRTYRTQQLTVHKDENGVWRSYAGLDKTVGYTGVVGNDTGWWYVENDVINFKYNGIGENDYGSWVVENGKVNTKYSGNYVWNGKMYKISGGMVVGTEPLTNKATTKAPTTTTTAPSTTTTVTESTTTHEHKWVAIYDGDAIVENLSRFCQCPECGLKFKDRELLEAHAHSMNHKLSADAADDAYNTGSDKQEVIVGYTNGAVKWVCEECGKETTNADEVDLDL